MKRIKTVFSAVLAVAAAAAAAKVDVKFTNGASRSLPEAVIRNGTLVLAQENLAIPLADVQNADFSFEALSQSGCEDLFNSGDYETAFRKLNEVLESVKDGWMLPGNIDFYLEYKIRVCFWTGRYDEMRKTASVLQAKKNPFISLFSLYEILVLIEEGQVQNAAGLFAQIRDPEKISVPMSEYIKARLAVSGQDYRKALQHLAAVIVFHSRDPEWLPAATFLEGTVYKKTEHADAAANIAEELRRAYPGTYWGLRAEELKVKSLK